MVSAPGNADAVFYFIGALPGCLFLQFLIYRTHLIHHFHSRIFPVRNRIRTQIPFSCQVDIPEFKRIYACLFRQHIDHLLGSSINLRRAESAVCNTEVVVGKGTLDKPPFTGNLIGISKEPADLAGDSRRHFRIGSVIKACMEFDSGKFAVLITGIPGVDPERGAFAGIQLVFLIGKDKGDRMLRYFTAGAKQSRELRAHGKAKASAHVSENHPERFLCFTDGSVNAGHIVIDGLAFVLNGQNTVFIIICLTAVPLNGKVGLSAGGKASFHDICGTVYYFPGAFFPFIKRLFDIDIGNRRDIFRRRLNLRMNLFRAFLYGLNIIRISRNGFDLHGYLCRRLSCRLRAVGRNNSDCIPIVEDPVLAKDRMLQSVGVDPRSAQRVFDPVCADDPDVVSCDQAEIPFHLLCF